MRLHRFILNIPLHKNVRIHDPEFFNQVKNVLRLSEGNAIIVADGVSHEAEATITGFDKDTVELTVGEITKNMAEPDKRITLYLSMLKNSNFELAAQKAVECGVADIIPIVSDRTVKLRANKSRLQKIVREAAEQSGRGAVPQLHDAKSLPDAIIHATSNEVNLVCHPKGAPIFSVLNQYDSAGTVGVFIGPEGGWSDDEKEMFDSRAKGDSRFVLTTLGSQILRAETAAIVATFIATNRFR